MLAGMGDQTTGADDHVGGSRVVAPGLAVEPGGGGAADDSPGDAWPQRWHGHDLRRLAGAGLVALWVGFLAVLWVGQVRLVPMSTLEDDLSSGQVVGYREVVLEHDGDGASRWTGSHVVGYTTVDDAGRLMDVDSDTSVGGRFAVGYWVDGPVATQRVVDPHQQGSADPEGAIARLQAAGVPAKAGFGSEFYARADRAGQVASALGLVGFGLVVLGPRPSRGTRWFWFWLLWAPLALGVLAYAVVELVRPGRLRRADDGHRRRSGLLGILIAWLGGGVVALGLAALADLAPVLLVRP